MRKIVLTLLATASFTIGCVPRQVIRPDPSVYHRLYRDTKAEIEVRGPDGKLYPQKVVLPKGSVVLTGLP